MPIIGDRAGIEYHTPAVQHERSLSFGDLVRQLNEALGPCSGLDSDEINPQDMQDIMKAYCSNAEEWRRYALADPSRNYTRNLVDEGNGKSNLLVLVWSPGRGSAIHDHANAHCVMKVLKGTLKETLYSLPQEQVDLCCPLEKKKETVLCEDDVTYISDEIGLHKIFNTSAEDFAISLHLYTPPHAAIHGFHLFDEATGKSSHVRQGEYYSFEGKRV